MQAHTLTTESPSENGRTTLTTSEQKEARLAQISQSTLPEETNTSTAWYMLGWNYLVGSAAAVQTLFDSLATPLSALSFSTWGPLLMKIASPLGLGLSWVNTGVAFKKLYQAENRNFWLYKDALLSAGTSIAWTILYAIGAVGALPVIAKVLPYVMTGIFGYYVLDGVTNFIKNCYLAYKANDKEQRNEYLWRAAKQVVSIVTNTIALTLSVFLGIKMTEAKDLFETDIMKAIDMVVEYYEKAANYLVALTASVCAGVAMNTFKMNAEMVRTIYNFVRHPLDTITQLYRAFTHHPVQSLVKLPIRLAALVVAPLQIVGVLVKMGFNLIFNRNSVKQTEQVVVTEVTPAKMSEIKEAEFKRVALSLRFQIKDFETKYDGDKTKAPSDICAKWTLDERLLVEKMGVKKETKEEELTSATFKNEVSVAGLERDAKEMDRNVYCSFFRHESRTKENVRMVERLQSAPAA